MRLLKQVLAVSLAACCFWPTWPAWAGDHVVIIGHPSMHKLDVITLQRIYTGKVIEIDGNPVTPINALPNQAVRQRFLSDYLQEDEDKFVAYWTVRRYVGKGTPPREVKDTASMIEQVNKTPGAIGYIDEADVTPGMNVLLRK